MASPSLPLFTQAPRAAVNEFGPALRWFALKHSAGGFGTPDTTPALDYARSIGPISLHMAIGTWVNKRSRRVTLPARVAELRLPEPRSEGEAPPGVSTTQT